MTPKPPIEVLRERYPLTVATSYLGSAFLLTYWSHDLQHGLILARSERSLLQTWERVARRKGAPKPVHLWSDTLVSAPQWFIDQRSERRYEEDVSQFSYRVSDAVREYVAEFGSYPPGTEPCESFNSKPDSDHYDCPKCVMGWVFDRYGLYESKRHVVDELSAPLLERSNRTKEKAYPQIRMSLPPDPDQPLYAVLSDSFRGTQLVELDEATTSPIAFFFQGAQSEAPAPFQEIYEALRKQKEEEEEAARAQRKTHTRRRNERLIRLAERVFDLPLSVPPRGHP